MLHPNISFLKVVVILYAINVWRMQHLKCAPYKYEYLKNGPDVSGGIG